MGACFDKFFCLQWAIWLAYYQKHYEIPFHPKKITLFYTYIVLYNCVKPYRCIDFYTYTNVNGHETLTWSVINFIMRFTLTWSLKSQTIYTHNIGIYTCMPQNIYTRTLRCQRKTVTLKNPLPLKDSLKTCPW